MSDHDHTLSLFIEPGQGIQNIQPGPGIERACGFVGKKDFRSVDQCPDDSRTLGFTAGDLGGRPAESTLSITDIPSIR